MFNVGPEKLVLLLILGLVILGPQQLPDAARAAGRAMARLRQLSEALHQQVHDAITSTPDDP